MIKRFLVPALALAAFGLPAGASITVYCNNTCGSNTEAAFISATAALYFPTTNPLGTPITFAGSGLSSGNQEYTDPVSLTQFNDLHGADQFSISTGGALQTQNSGIDSVGITVPAAYTAIMLDLSQFPGANGFLCLDTNCNNFVTLSSSSTTFVGFISTTPIGSFTLAPGPGSLIINDFDVAGPGNQAQTPEVGTMLLIGAGLISMRWMKRLPKPRFFHSPRIA